MSNPQQAQRQLSKRAQMARYVVFVDNQAKSSFDTMAAAEKEAKRIKDGYPILAVRVADSETDSAKMLGPTKAKDEPDDN